MKVVAGVSEGAGSLIIGFFSGVTECAFRFTNSLSFTCTVAIRGDRNGRFSTIVVPVFSNPPRLCCEGLLCATIAETGGALILINGPSAIRCVMGGGHHAGQCDNLGRFLLESSALCWRDFQRSGEVFLCNSLSMLQGNC